MTGGSFAGVAFVRIVLAAVVSIDVLTFYWFLGSARAHALAAGALGDGFNELVSRPVVRGGVVVAGIAAAIAFGRRPGRLWHGLLALMALSVLSTAHTQLFGSPWRHLFFGGVCLTGWLIGLAVTRSRGAPKDESYAFTGSVALLGAAYLSSGISKVVFGGAIWISGLPVQSAIVAQNGLVSDGLGAAYREWVVTTPSLAGVFSTATTALELGGPLMLVGRRTRFVVALGLLAMHLNIFLLTTHILYWESMALLLVLGLSRDPFSEDRAPARSGSVGPENRRFAMVVAALTLCGLVAIAHQARRHARDYDPHMYESKLAAVVEAPETRSPHEESLPPQPPPPVEMIRQVGPFTVGQKLTGSWSIGSLDLSEDGFTISVVGEAGRARFDFTCSASRGSGPFDVEGAHILYSQHVAFRDLEDAGKALQKQFREATAGSDVCERLRAWREVAQASLQG